MGQSRLGEIAGRGAGRAMSSARAHKDAQTNAPRARLLQRFHLAHAHQGGEFVAFTDHYFGFGGSGTPRALDHIGR